MIICTIDLNTDPCHCVTMDSDLIFSSSPGWDLTMASGGATGHSKQPCPLHPWVSGSTSLHNAQLLCFSFFPICLPQICILWLFSLQLGHVAGSPPPITSSISLHGRAASGCLWPACAVHRTAGLWMVCELQVSFCLRPLLLCSLVVGRALCCLWPTYAVGWRGGLWASFP